MTSKFMRRKEPNILTSRYLKEHNTTNNHDAIYEKKYLKITTTRYLKKDGTENDPVLKDKFLKNYKGNIAEDLSSPRTIRKKE